MVMKKIRYFWAFFFLFELVLSTEPLLAEPKPRFSLIIDSLLDDKEEDFFNQNYQSLLNLEVFYNHPLVFHEITKSDLDDFFFLTENEKRNLLKLASKTKLNSLAALEKEQVLSEESFSTFQYFIKFIKRSSKDKALKVDYRIGMKNNRFLSTDPMKLASYQMRSDFELAYQMDKSLFNFYLFLEKDTEETALPQFFKFSLGWNWGDDITLNLGALNINLNQNLLFSTKNPSFSFLLNERGGYRKTSRITLDKGRRETYFSGIASTYKWQNLTFLLFAGNYLYHLELIEHEPLYPQLEYSDTFNFSEVKNFVPNEKSLKEKIIGLHVNHVFEQLQLSGSFVFSQLSNPLIQDDHVYGKESYGMSLAWDYLGRDLIFFGEMALLVKEDHPNGVYSLEERTYSVAPAWLTGIRYLEKNIFSTMVLRFITEDYRALHNNVYTAFRDKRDELGIFASLRGRVDNFTLGLSLDYATRVFNNREFIFTAIPRLKWQASSGYYFVGKVRVKNNLSMNEFNFSFINGFKRNVWELALKINYPLSSEFFNFLSEINFKLSIQDIHVTSLKIGWGREENENLFLFFFYSALFYDFIHLENDSFWVLWKNEIVIHDLLKLEFNFGLIWRTDSLRNYAYDKLNQDLSLSFLLKTALTN